VTTPEKTVKLQDYTPPAYLITQIDLDFDLYDNHTLVRSILQVHRNPLSASKTTLQLHGEKLALKDIKLNNHTLEPKGYHVDATILSLFNPPDTFTLSIETEIKPHENTELEGLYQSNELFCTQCEAEGFRKITYFPDRPDIMSRFTTTIRADKARFPVLLSNGNKTHSGDLDNGRHFVTWQDPFNKPCYLFALVAGDLAVLEDHYVTQSQRRIALEIYVAAQDIDKCQHAMDSLKHAMRWDEETFGLEYDLDNYLIVAVSDFNMGAMENKGLNVFNTKYVLADQHTATDNDYEGIESVIAHEYFHNWTGNRVTCRDWFQLSLKEGLTVFRDQQFSADMSQKAVKRIQDVNVLRNAQFSEDAGPMSHPIQPQSYLSINNFYTVTVYNKGAEVVRMIHTLLGTEGFRKGMDLYFQRHDSQAVTTEEFVSAMEDANAYDLTQFRRWYTQSGTPVVHVDSHYDTIKQRVTLTFRQHTPPTADQTEKQPLLIPINTALLDPQGQVFPQSTRTLVLKDAEESFTFENIPVAPTPSLLRNFSAPVKLHQDHDLDTLTFLFSHDNDPFNRWDAGQQLFSQTILQNMITPDTSTGNCSQLSQAVLQTLQHPTLDKSLIAQALTLPSENYLSEQLPLASSSGVDAQLIHHTRQQLLSQLATTLQTPLLDLYQVLKSALQTTTDIVTARGLRKLKNLCLSYLMTLEDDDMNALAYQQFEQSDNMTDAIAALGLLTNTHCPQRPVALADFYQKWQHEALVIDKWFGVQATSRLPDTLTQVQGLLQHEAFDINNPNKLRSLISTFCFANPALFHAKDGSGYQFLTQQILDIDSRNPHMAARLASAFNRWKKYTPDNQKKMHAQLEIISNTETLSKDTTEIISRSLHTA